MNVWEGTVLGMAFNAWRMTSFFWQAFIETQDPGMFVRYRESLKELHICITAISD